MSARDGPGKEGNAGNWHNVGLDGEKVADLMHGKPKEWQAADPEEDKGDKVAVVCDAGSIDRMTNVVERRPDGTNHEVDTLATNPRLDTIPDACHDGAVEDGPQRAPDTERSSAHNRETNVILGTNAASHADEAGGNGVANPDAQPGLPPAQATIFGAHNHGR